MRAGGATSRSATGPLRPSISSRQAACEELDDAERLGSENPCVASSARFQCISGSPEEAVHRVGRFSSGRSRLELRDRLDSNASRGRPDEAVSERMILYCWRKCARGRQWASRSPSIAGHAPDSSNPPGNDTHQEMSASCYELTAIAPTRQRIRCHCRVMRSNDRLVASPVGRDDGSPAWFARP